jgi:hypothetical protein
VICLIVGASFFVFAIDQTKSASAQQTEEVTARPAVGTSTGTTTTATATTSATTASGTASNASGNDSPSAPKKENSVHKALDEASSSLTSPFAGVLASSDSEWATRGVKLLLALIVYGFGLGYLARMLRVRV